MAEAIITSTVDLFLFDAATTQYAEHGTAGIAVVGTPGAPGTYRLGCYAGDAYLCTANVTSNNDTGIQFSIIGPSYASFRDDQQRIWSIKFNQGDAECYRFAAGIAVAMYGAANQPEGSVVTLDVAAGRRERVVLGGDKVKVRYTSWVATRGEPAHAAVPKLGSELESNENDQAPFVFGAPPNHNSVTADMKGFEGMVVGMAEEARRFIVVPKAAKRGGGPNVHQVWMINVVKKKDNAADEVDAYKAMVQARAGGAGTSGALIVAGQQQQQQQGPHVVVVQQPFGADMVRYDPNAAAPAPAAPQPPPPAQAAAPPPPPPGFNYEQMELVNRMRDQSANVLMQIKSAQERIDMLCHDMRQGIAAQKPKSLHTAQMQFTLSKMLDESETLKTTLDQRDGTLRQLEERNKDLQGKADAFSATANRLSEEKKAAAAETSNMRLEGDQKTLQLQAELTRILAEREDTVRHLTTVKRLLEISDQDAKKEKQGLQTAEVQMGTIEAKLASTEESGTEERSRRKLLEGKIATLGDELRALMEEVRVKDSQMDERRRKMEADKLHYSQIMDEERNRAAEELRELRQELVDEITLRDRRYQEERVRVGKESFERGRLQGIEDGRADAAMEVDARMQQLSLEAQRHRSEVESIKVRLRQTHETADASRRRQDAHIAALGRVVDDLGAQVGAAETELRALESTRVTAQDAAAETLLELAGRLNRPITRGDLLGALHSLRSKRPIDFSFEGRGEEDERRRVAGDEATIRAWARRRLNAPVSVPAEVAPVLITPWLDDDRGAAALMPSAVDSSNAADDATGAAAFNSTFATADGPMMPQFVEAVERRQQELLSMLHRNDPLLELIVEPPPPPPPPPPPRAPTPEPEPEPEPVVAAPVAAPVSQQQQQDSDEEEDGAPTPAPSPAVVAAAAADSESDEQATAATGGAAAVPISAQLTAGSDEEDASVVAAAPRAAEDAEEEEETTTTAAPPVRAAVPAPKKPAAAAQWDSDEEDAPAPAPKLARKPAAKKPTSMFGADSDEEEEPAAAPAAKPAAKLVASTAAAKKGAFAESDSDAAEEPVVRKTAPVVAAPPAPKPTARQQKMFADSDSDESSFGAPAAAKKPATKTAATAPAAKRAAPSAALFGAGSDSDETDADSRPVFRPAAKAAPKVQAKATAAAAQKKSLFADSSDSDGPGFAPPARVTPAAKAPAKKPAAKKSMFADSESD